MTIFTSCLLYYYKVGIVNYIHSWWCDYNAYSYPTTENPLVLTQLLRQVRPEQILEYWHNNSWFQEGHHTHTANKNANFLLIPSTARWACQREPLRWAQTQTDVTFPQNEASLVLMNEHTHWAWILPASMGWQTMHVASSRICHSLLPVSNPSCHIRATEATRISRAATRALWVIYHIFCAARAQEVHKTK